MITSYKIFESKQVGNLYHFTNLISLYSILEDDRLQTNREVESYDNLMRCFHLQNKGNWMYISFTRNKNFHKISQESMDHPLSCRLTIDGNKLSHKYKIYSIDYFESDSKYRNKEDEECVVVRYEFENINQYILKIEIPTLEKFKWEVDKGLGEDDYSYKFENICSHFGLDEYEEYKEKNTKKSLNILTKKLYDEIINRIEYDNKL